MTRKTIITREDYEQLANDIDSESNQRDALADALADLTVELVRGTARMPHSYRVPPRDSEYRPPSCACGLRRAHPIHHPALRILDVAPVAGARRYDA